MICNNGLSSSATNFLLCFVLYVFALHTPPVLAAEDSYSSSLPIPATEKFYIYEWWGLCRKMNCREKSNFGAGRTVNSTNGIYDTYQYDLFNLMYSRFFLDPRRTTNPDEATTFILSYDPHFDSMTFRKPNGKQDRSFFEGSSDYAPEVVKLLEASPHFQKKKGKDHLLIVGWPYAISQLILKPKAVPLFILCDQCTKLTIENYSFLYSSDPKNDRTIAQQYKGDNWFAVPYPSNFHWSANIKPPLLYEEQDRPYLVSYIGSSTCFSEFSTAIRHDLVKYCTVHAPDCQHAHYSKHGPRNSDLAEGLRDPHYQYTLRSTFCLQPLGDTTTRKGLFDAIMFGCIPVVFHPLSASAMYTWHWSTQLWKDVIIEIPINMSPAPNEPALLSDPILYLKQLYEKDVEDIRRRQRLMRRHAFELSYALEFYKEGSSWPLDEQGKPVRDAYEITMDHVLGLHAGRATQSIPGDLLGEKRQVWKAEIDRLLPAYYNEEFMTALKKYEQKKGKKIAGEGQN